MADAARGRRDDPPRRLAPGRAEVATGDDPKIAAEIRRSTRRYFEPAEVDAYISGWAGLQTIVRIRPDQITRWGRGY